MHPMSTHTVYFWRTPLAQNKKYLKKCDEDIWVKTQGAMSKIRTKKVFFYDTYPQIYIKKLFKTYTVFQIWSNSIG